MLNLVAYKPILQAHMDKEVTVVSRVLANDGFGGSTVVETTLGIWPCLVIPYRLRPREDVNAVGLESSIAFWRIIISTLLTTPTIAPKDRLLVGGKTFEVISVQDQKSYKIALRVICAEIT